MLHAVKLVITFGLLSVDPAAAFTHALAIDPHEPRGCVEAELQRRTVFLKTDRASCSGVITGPTSIRTAGRCFGLFPHADYAFGTGGEITMKGSQVHREGGEQIRGFEIPDQGEVRLAAPGLPQPEVPRVDLSGLRGGETIVLAGYGWGGFQGSIYQTFKAPWRVRYVVGRLELRQGLGRGRRFTAYRVKLQHLSAMMGPSDVGGGAFVVNGCDVKWLGTVLARRRWLHGPTEIYVRPHSDLK